MILWKDQCENKENGIRLGLTAEGDLMLSVRGGRWEDARFNENYQGYYPACRFTAIAGGEGMFYAAGTDGDGGPHLFTSLMGGVWNEIPLIDGQTGQTPGAEVVSILFEEESAQAYLICGDGNFVTVPDCARCIRVRRAAEAVVKEAFFADGDVTLVCADGGRIKIPAAAARQYRASADFLAKLFSGRGGYLLDFREDAAADQLPEPLSRQAAARILTYRTVPFAGFKRLLSDIPDTEPVAFVCLSGALADEAAVYARKRGYRRAYALLLDDGAGQKITLADCP